MTFFNTAPEHTHFNANDFAGVEAALRTLEAAGGSPTQVQVQAVRAAVTAMQTQETERLNLRQTRPGKDGTVYDHATVAGTNADINGNPYPNSPYVDGPFDTNRPLVNPNGNSNSSTAANGSFVNPQDGALSPQKVTQ